MIFPQVKAVSIGTKVLPNYTIKGLGQSRGEEALVYRVPNNEGREHSTKRIRCSEWEMAYRHLLNGGHITREWFNQNIPDAAKDGGCAFRVIGEIFAHLGVATRVDEGSISKYVPVG